MSVPMNKNQITIEDGKVYIKLRGDTDKTVIIDEDDFDKLEDRSWYLSGYKRRYAVAGKSYRCHQTGKRRYHLLYLHRVIIGEENIPEGMTVDHIDNNPMNCCRDNLRVCTIGENSMNRSKSNGTKSKYKGIQPYGKKKTRWATRITANRKTIHIGNFDTEKQAAIAYDLAALKYHGEYALLNFPRSNYE